MNSKALAGLLPPECFHVTAGKSGAPKRTKFFFGARYLWTREQMSSIASARRAHGVRVDVPAVPSWIQVIHMYTHIHMHARTHARMHAHMHTRTQTNLHTHAHTSSCVVGIHIDRPSGHANIVGYV